MLFVNYSIDASADKVLDRLLDGNTVETAENYDTQNGKPNFHVKAKDSIVKIKCEMMGRGTKDNAFLEGTYFIGKITEKDCRCRLRGLIITAPIYHLLFAALFVFFIIQCFSGGGFSPIPVILLGFDIVMFKDEFRKQGLIKRYIFRAFKLTYLDVSEGKK